MRKLYLALLLSILWAGIIVAADTNVTIDGVNYILDTSSGTAKVTSSTDGYKGKTLTIPSYITYTNRTFLVNEIGESAFCVSQYGSHEGVVSVNLPTTITKIGKFAFSYNYSLTSIIIPTNVEKIEEKAFCGCELLISIELSDRLTYIGANAFMDCKSLISINLPEGLTYIGATAFQNCSILSSITIPTTVTSIGNNAFDGCTNLKTIVWNAKHCIDFTSGDVAPFNTEYKEYKGNGQGFSYYRKNEYTTSITFGNNVEYIPAYLCYNFFSLLTLDIPNSVKEIGESAFYSYFHAANLYGEDNNLTSLSLGTGLEKIGAYAFYYRTKLSSITIPDNCTTICPYAFFACDHLSSITLGKRISTIGNYAFGARYNNQSGVQRYETNINTINIYSPTPPVITHNVFDQYNDLMSITLNVRSIAIDAYKASDVWKDMYVQVMENDLRTFTLDVSSADENMGTTSAGGMFDEDSEVLIYAAAKDGYKFSKWNDDNTDNPRTVKMISDLSFVAYFEAVFPDNPTPGGDNPDDPEPVTNSDTDISSMNNVIYLNKVEASADSQINLSIRMKNTVGIRGFQFDIYLPDGVTVVKSAKGKIIGSLSDDRLPEDDEHSLTLSEQSDGAIRFLCGSLYDETFTGNDGEIATLTVKTAENMSDGDYSIILRNMKLTETDINNYYQTDYVKSTLTIKSYTLGDINSDQKIDVSDYIGIANHILGNTPDGFVVKAADVNVDGNIDVSDYIGVANIILTGSIYGSNSNAPVMNFEEEENLEVDPD